MGFLSGLSGVLGGGSQQSGKGSSQSGFSLLPPEIQDAYKSFGTKVGAQINNPNLTNMYTPLAQTAGETKAYDAINQGFAPNQQTLNSDIAMQMNPYDSSVIDTINRQGQGQYSVLKQALGEAGQMGSNRQNLGANDIDLSRLQQIGTFKQGQFNNALQNSLTTLPGLRQQDAQAQLGAGANQRQLAGQTAQAPVAALQQIGAALGILPNNGGANSTNSSSGSSSQNGTFGNLLGLAGGLFSDIRLKEDIIPIGEENGHAIYEFKYKGKPERYIGVMAQEVQKTNPEAVIKIDGYLAVNYDTIGVQFREAE